MSSRIAPWCAAVLALSAASSGKAASGGAAAPSQVAATPLRVLSTVQLQGRPDFLAWQLPTQCDPNGNVFLLLQPHATADEVAAASRSGRALSFDPRQVLRIANDGQTTASLDPARGRFAEARSLTTLAIALDERGTLFLLV